MTPEDVLTEYILPAEDLPAPGNDLEPPAQETVTKPSLTRHLLVVDDEPHVRILLSQYLQQARFTVDLAENGNEAWRKVQSQTYDCIIMDLKMPGMRGQQLYWDIQSFDEDLAKRIIFITGDTASRDTGGFIASMDNPSLSKPFGLEELRREISAILEVAAVSQ